MKVHICILIFCYFSYCVLSSEISHEIKERKDEIMKVFKADNISAIATFYSTDGVMMLNGRDPIKGRAAIEALFKEDQEVNGITNVKLKTDEIDGSGDWAYERGSYSMELRNRTMSGAYLLVWKKVDGHWFIHMDCSTVIKPAPH